jgi:hypothetical protein
MGIENLTLAPFYGDNRNPFNYVKVEEVTRDSTTHWITTSELADQLNLFSDSSQDAQLDRLELATRQALEDYLGMPIFATQFRVFYNDPGTYGLGPTYFDLPEISQQVGTTPGVTINSVVYYQQASNTTPATISSSLYSYDPTGNRVIVSSIPNDINTQVAAPIVITYTVNASPLASYPVIKQAGLLLFTHLYNNRSAVGKTVGAAAQIPFGVDVLLRKYKPLVM